MKIPNKIKQKMEDKNEQFYEKEIDEIIRDNKDFDERTSISKDFGSFLETD